MVDIGVDVFIGQVEVPAVEPPVMQAVLALRRERMSDIDPILPGFIATRLQIDDPGVRNVDGR
ncbi:hypothetical protein D3C86_2125110 [compost metagenome]